MIDTPIKMINIKSIILLKFKRIIKKNIRPTKIISETPANLRRK